MGYLELLILDKAMREPYGGISGKLSTHVFRIYNSEQFINCQFWAAVGFKTNSMVKKSKLSKEKELEVACRSTILNANICKIRDKCYELARLNDLQSLTPDKVWLKKGESKFEATAEVFFVPKEAGGKEFSTGERFSIEGCLKEEDGMFQLTSPIRIDGDINVYLLKESTQS